MKVLPCPGRLSRWTSPPRSLVSSRTIERPRPVPWCSRVRTPSPWPGWPAWRNFSKIVSRSSSAIPMPGVGHRDHHEPPLGVGPERDPAPFGRELDRVGEQVVEDLAELAGVLPHQRDRLVEPAFQVDVLPLGDRPGQRGEGLADVADREVLGPDLHLAALDLGQVEDVVDHPQEHLARGLDVRRVPPLPVVELVGAGEDLGEPDDRVQRASAARGSSSPGSRS